VDAPKIANLPHLAEHDSDSNGVPSSIEQRKRAARAGLPRGPVDPWLVPPDTAGQRVADKRRQPMRLSALFEEFLAYLRVEREAAPRTVQTYQWCFGDFLAFAAKTLGGTVLVVHFDAAVCRAYHYDLGARSLQTNSIRVRLATLGSFGKWAVRYGRLQTNPLDQLTRPRRKKRLPVVPKWETIEKMLTGCASLRNRAILALLTYGGLRRSEVVSVNVGDVVPDFGLRRLVGKGGHEAAVPLPRVARTILSDYVNAERRGATADDPLFIVRFKVKGGGSREDRMRDHRVFKIVKALGKQAGIPKLHPHAFRHSCGVELLRRTHGNLRAVQEHLRHADIQTTTLYTRLTQGDLKKVVSVFDVKGE
jgi:integrase/recombinase XerC